MSKTTVHNSEASFEVRELTAAELDEVTGGFCGPMQMVQQIMQMVQQMQVQGGQ